MSRRLRNQLVSSAEGRMGRGTVWGVFVDGGLVDDAGHFERFDCVSLIGYVRPALLEQAGSSYWEVSDARCHPSPMKNPMNTD